MDANSRGDFIGMLFHSVDYYNLYRHSISGIGTMSVNNILEKTGKELFDLTNNLLETTQSEEFIEVIIPPTRVVIDSSEFTKTLLEFVRGNRGIFLPYQSTIIDQIEILLSKTLYRIKYLK